MLLAVVSDVVWQALIGGIVTLALAWMAQRTKQAVEDNTKEARKAAEQAAGKVEAVKNTLDETTLSTDKKLNDIHTLVNSNMGVQLKIAATALKRIASMTSHPDDIAASNLANTKLAEHESKQNEVDQAAQAKVT